MLSRRKRYCFRLLGKKRTHAEKRGGERKRKRLDKGGRIPRETRRPLLRSTGERGGKTTTTVKKKESSSGKKGKKHAAEQVLKEEHRQTVPKAPEGGGNARVPLQEDVLQQWRAREETGGFPRGRREATAAHPVGREKREERKENPNALLGKKKRIVLKATS